VSTTLFNDIIKTVSSYAILAYFIVWYGAVMYRASDLRIQIKSNQIY